LAIDAGRRYAEQWSMATLMDAYDERYDEAVRRFQMTR
jgi:hypothetical protein